MFFKKNYTPIKQATNVIDCNFLVQLEPTCSLIYVRLPAFILLLALSALSHRCSVRVSTFHVRCVELSSLSLPSHFLLFFSYSIQTGRFGFSPFESSLTFFFLFSVQLVSEFLVVFPASRFSISFPLRSSLYAPLSNPFLHPHSHLRHPFHLRARFSRNYFYPRL